MDDLARAQELQALAQRRARHAQFFGQPPFGRQRLAGLEHAIQDQAFDALGDLVRHLAGFFCCFRVHSLSGPVV
jgi:hypothetical protein